MYKTAEAFSIPLGLIPRSLLRFNPEQNIKYPVRLRRGFLLPVLCMLLTVGCGTLEDVKEPSNPPEVTPFTELSAVFTHQWDEKRHPFLGAAVTDLNNDGKLELFVGGGQNQKDALLVYQNGQLVNLIDNYNLSRSAATHGVTSFDMDNDQDSDLIIARDNGVYLYINQGEVSNWQFTEIPIPVKLDTEALVLDAAVSDINKDGLPDIYLSAFVRAEHFESAVFNNPEHAKTNCLLINQGNYRFKDVTLESGVQSKQNTFMSVFVDLNNDQREELLVSQNTGQIEIFSPTEDGKFKSVDFASGFGFWMGLAVGDVDNDGDQDLFLSNLGNSIPNFLTTGDLTDEQPHNPNWKLLINKGGNQLEDQTRKYLLHDYGFSWGAVFEDLNLDGRMDLLVAQNYIKWPFHKLDRLPNKAFLQLKDSGHYGFFHINELNLNNPWFGQSPVIIDLNGDGRQDIVWINIDGPARAFIHNSTANFVTLRLPDNIEFSGARVMLETDPDQSYARVVTNSVGMLTDQTTDLSFALGSAEVATLVIEKLNGDIIRLEGLEANRIHNLF